MKQKNLASTLLAVFLIFSSIRPLMANAESTASAGNDAWGWGAIDKGLSAREPAVARPKTLRKQIEKKKRPNQEVKLNTPEPTLPTQGVPEGEDSFGITGGWGGARKKLSDKGLNIGIIYKGDWTRNLSGGVEKKTMYLDNLDIKFNIDGEKAFGAKGLSFFIYGIANTGADRGARPSLMVGDSQWTSNIESFADDLRLYEAWAQYVFEEEKISVLAGLHDLNSEFYVADTAGLFLHSSYGIGLELSQTGTNGSAVFPYTAPSIRIRSEPNSRVYFQSAVFNGAAGDPNKRNGSYFNINPTQDGVLFINELGLTGTEDSPHKLALGYWAYTGTYNHLNTTLTDSDGNTVNKQVGSSGAYAFFDKTFSKKLSAFVKYGFASTQSNQIRDNLVAGFVIKGLIPSRDEDKIGLGISRVTAGPEFIDQMNAAGTPIASAETAAELTYRFEVMTGLALQPDFQYVMSPIATQGVQTQGSHPNATVGSIRVELSL